MRLGTSTNSACTTSRPTFCVTKRREEKMDRPAVVVIATSGAVLVVGRSLLLKQYRALYETIAVGIFRTLGKYSYLLRHDGHTG